MADTKRPWRRPESYDAELITRDAVGSCLKHYGFTDVTDTRRHSGPAIIQTVSARSPKGVPMNMRVKLCWRREGGVRGSRLYSAFQVSADLVDDDWEKTVGIRASKYRSEGATHVLAVQPGELQIDAAAAIPCDQLAAIWRRQDEIGHQLIQRGQAGKITKSPARNGKSPTIYLMDDRTPFTHAIADALWVREGVINIRELEPVLGGRETADDTFDDCAVDLTGLGRDQGAKVGWVRSGYVRDPKVRLAVLERAGGKCERNGCGQARTYAGFLDVHHIFGVGRSDRPWSCVALCPNCHREAHFAPEAELINAKLAEYAAQHAK